jgi:hypothetical protein
MRKIYKAIVTGVVVAFAGKAGAGGWPRARLCAAGSPGDSSAAIAAAR